MEERYCPITELAKIGVMLIKQSIIVKKIYDQEVTDGERTV